MAGFVAKKLCPHLKFVKLDFALYTSCSKSIMKILGQYGEISPASLDEAYCSLTEYCKRENVTPAVAAERMRAQVLAETGLSVSAGVSPNAMLSKVAAVSVLRSSYSSSSPLGLAGQEQAERTVCH